MQVYALRHRSERLGKIREAGVRRRAVQEPVCGRHALVLASVHYVLKLPGILITFGNDLAGFLVDRKLARRKQDSCALISLIADVQFEGREVVIYRAGGPDKTAARRNLRGSASGPRRGSCTQVQQLYL